MEGADLATWYPVIEVKTEQTRTAVMSKRRDGLSKSQVKVQVQARVIAAARTCGTVSFFKTLANHLANRPMGWVSTIVNVCTHQTTPYRCFCPEPCMKANRLRGRRRRWEASANSSPPFFVHWRGEAGAKR